MDLSFFLDRYPETWILTAGGLIVGVVFGAFAQQSRFCLRAAALDFSHGILGVRLSVWLMTFSAAVLGTQVLASLGEFQMLETRQLASPQSLSGAAIGGLLFGSGMVLARGCASRLLVLSATGNLRALLSGLVFAVIAQASLRGILRPAREGIAGWWTTADIGGNNLMDFLSMTFTVTIGLSLLWLAAGIFFAFKSRAPVWQMIAALLAGCAIPLAWWFTSSMASQAFQPVKIGAVTFTGPSADFLMLFLSAPEAGIDFDIGIVPGVFLGSFLAALLTRELVLQGFEGGKSMARYMTGAAMMGFGGMLAGGCAVGAGVTGASVVALTAWVTLTCIWFSAALTDRLVDPQPSGSPTAEPEARPQPAE